MKAIISELCTPLKNARAMLLKAQILLLQELHFHWRTAFKEELFSMMNQMKEILNEGGSSVEDIKVN